ncbi:uncharacterized mitochondrial protein AtMg00810-like [Rutidosis leptorrhynchoides]|uniref:uncharacterized mitochondrial protein AtMg00810-like n=1 Tax=Rutidosis leptorrhynchoides TaxID=125765 RepID=UPI003A990BE3
MEPEGRGRRSTTSITRRFFDDPLACESWELTLHIFYYMWTTWSKFSTAFLQQSITSLHREFSMTDLELMNYFLGIPVTRNSSGMFLSQKKYDAYILECADMTGCQSSMTLVETCSKVLATGPFVADPNLYRSLACALQYITFTRLDIAYVVQQICLFMHDPREQHFFALK